MAVPEPGTIAELAEAAIILGEMHWIPGPDASTACGSDAKMLMGTRSHARVSCPDCSAIVSAVSTVAALTPPAS
jgi:hypothetical protein